MRSYFLFEWERIYEVLQTRSELKGEFPRGKLEFKGYRALCCSVVATGRYVIKFVYRIELLEYRGVKSFILKYVRQISYIFF